MIGRKELAQRRQAALQSGAKVYAGNPCKAGHDGARYATTRHCVQCAIAAVQTSRKAAAARSVAS